MPAIELVSPGNKDRPQARKAFAAKCAEHLGRGCGLVIVDVVTTRHADVLAELFAALGIESPHHTSGVLNAISFRSLGRDVDGQLFAWPEPLAVGEPLPTLPLWIGPELSVPLDLEASHNAACADLEFDSPAEVLTIVRAAYAIDK